MRAREAEGGSTTFEPHSPIGSAAMGVGDHPSRPPHDPAHLGTASFHRATDWDPSYPSSLLLRL